jgi:hypothetical protein
MLMTSERRPAIRTIGDPKRIVTSRRFSARRYGLCTEHQAEAVHIPRARIRRVDHVFLDGRQAVVRSTTLGGSAWLAFGSDRAVH